MIMNILYRLKSGTENLNYGRHIVKQWAQDYLASHANDRCRLLDIGLGSAADVENIRTGKMDNAEYFGIENYAPSIQNARNLGIEVVEIDIESSSFPFAGGSFDIVVANQIIEHTKEIFWIYSEVARILKPGGIFIVGVPNLASLHCRTALLAGMQPPVIKTLGPHVRGFTKEGMREFAEINGYFRMHDYRGSNFYPFPPAVSKKLSSWFPQLAVSNFYLFERTSKEGSFLEILDQQFFETPYFRGAEADQSAGRL